VYVRDSVHLYIGQCTYIRQATVDWIWISQYSHVTKYSQIM